MILFELFATFFQIGLFTIGGGYAMIPLITDMVITRGWATPEQLMDWIAIGESTPGPFSVNVAVFIGMDQSGILGAVVAVLGLVLPSFIIILIIARFLTRFIEYKGVTAALRGLNPAAIGLILAAAVSIGMTAFNLGRSSGFDEPNITSIIIFLIVFALSRIKKLKFNAHKIILTSAVLGVVLYGFVV